MQLMQAGSGAEAGVGSWERCGCVCRCLRVSKSKMRDAAPWEHLAPSQFHSVEALSAGTPARWGCACRWRLLRKELARQATRSDRPTARRTAESAVQCRAGQHNTAASPCVVQVQSVLSWDTSARAVESIEMKRRVRAPIRSSRTATAIRKQSSP